MIWTLPCCPIPFSLVQIFPPLPCVNKCVKGGRVRVSGAQTNKHLPQSPFTGKFFRWRHFALPSMSFIFLRPHLQWGGGGAVTFWNSFIRPHETPTTPTLRFHIKKKWLLHIGRKWGECRKAIFTRKLHVQKTNKPRSPWSAKLYICQTSIASRKTKSLVTEPLCFRLRIVHTSRYQHKIGSPFNGSY